MVGNVAPVNIKHFYQIFLGYTKTFYEQQDSGKVRLGKE